MRSKEQTHYLGQEKIPKLMLKFSIPCILSLLVSALYNIVDQVFIGNSEMSALGNAATGVVFPIFPSIFHAPRRPRSFARFFVHLCTFSTQFSTSCVSRVFPATIYCGGWAGFVRFCVRAVLQ